MEAQFGLITREEALASVFPDATAAAERIFLTDEQAERIETIARVDLDSKLYARYIVSRRGVVVGRAYVDTHQVRTAPVLHYGLNMADQFRESLAHCSGHL